MKDNTVMPRLCPHCHGLTSRPRSFITLLEALSPGKGHSFVALGSAEIARRMGITRQRVGQIIPDAIKAGVVELNPKVIGAAAYRKTWYGNQVLSRWKSVGWKGDK